MNTNSVAIVCHNNWLSAGFVVVQPSRKATGNYSVMAADRVVVSAASTVMGEITSEGRLLNQTGDVQANYRQRFRSWRGSRVLQLTIELEPLTSLEDDPWNSYYCCRFAWANEAATLWRGVNQLRERAEAKRFEAPNYIDIDDDGPPHDVADRRTPVSSAD